ncbi:FAD-binding oxidoreductase, partial [Arthrospira platensis SPKY1]|nr:FAD-binding oxidoreductase [Arthrospira platensis SPKY1]
GQFVELSIPGVGEAPFTPSSSPAVSDKLEITIMQAGMVTQKIHALQSGATIGIRGPLGKAYPLDKFQGREVLIVGGGVGLAPLRALLFALFENMERYTKIFLRYGARTPKDIVYKEALSAAWGQGKRLDIQVTVDKGDETWTGRQGVVTTILEPDLLPFHPDRGV